MRRIYSFATVALLALSSTASAQRGRASTMPSSNSGSNPIELGADAALTIGFGAPAGTSNVTYFDVPVAQVRAGFFISPELSIEPSLGIQYASATGGSATHYNLGLGALYHFSTMRTSNQIYVRPFVNFESASISGNGTSNSSTSVALGAGLGIKVPMADRFAWRFEANLAHNNNNNFDNSPNRMGLLAGLSYFTH